MCRITNSHLVFANSGCRRALLGRAGPLQCTLKGQHRHLDIPSKSIA